MADERLLSRSFTLAFMANLAQGLSFTLFLHLPGYLSDLGASEVEIGLIFASAAVASVLVRPIVGRLMDVRGRRVVILSGGVLNTGVILLYLTVDSIGPWVYTVRLVHGIAVALLFTSLFTYAADRVPAARRTQGLALFGISGMLPIALGGLLGDLVLHRYDFTALFVAAALFGALALGLSMPLRDHPELLLGLDQPRRRFGDALLQPDLRPMWWIAGVFSVALAAYFTFLKTFVQETGLGSVGLFFGAYAAMAISIRIFFGWLPDRVGQKRVLFPALAVFGAGFVVLAFAGSDAAVAAAGALCGAGHGYVFPILYGMVVTRARPAERGSAMAIYTALFDVGTLIGGPAFGLAIGLGGYRTMFLVAAGTVAVGSIAFATWDRRFQVTGPVPASQVDRLTGAR